MKTHPLSRHALDVLTRIAAAPIPRLLVNPGVRARFEREGLVNEVLLPSPFAKDKGDPYPHYTLSAAGRAVLDDNS